MDKTEKLLRSLFDLQHFEKNERLDKVIHGAAPGTWLYAITRNAVASFYREKIGNRSLLKYRSCPFPPKRRNRFLQMKP